MNVVDDQALRLQFLARVATRQSRHLELTDQRVFAQPFTLARAETLESDIELADRVEAFASRFARLQDTLGDKLIPALLHALGEPVGPALDNLDRAERFGWISAVDDWMAARQWRNQMVHEYIEDLAILADALQAGHESVPMLIKAAKALRTQLQKRGWLREQ